MAERVTPEAVSSTIVSTSRLRPRQRSVGTSLVRWGGLFAGPLAAVLVYLLLPGADEAGDGGLTPGGRATASVAALMAVWWLTEAIPISATSLLPVALLPLLGAATISQAAGPYGSDLIFLFLGGFILGLGMERWGLHRRIALVTILLVGTRPTRLIAGFMLAAAIMSMWVSNTATAVMMMPIGVSVIGLVSEHVRRMAAEDGADPEAADRFAVCLMLGLAYGCTIGGIGTLIGSPPNLVFANFVSDRYGVEISMVDWMRVGLPLTAVLLPVAWLFLTRVAYPIRLGEIPGGRELIRDELDGLGRMKPGEWAVLAVFSLAAFCWIFRPWIARVTGMENLSDPGIAVAAALLLFVIPVNPRRRVFVMDWEHAVKLPWGILLLFGGGLSLASAISANGVDTYLGSLFEGLAGVPLPVVLLVVCAGVKLLSELTSNTAVTTTVLPVLAGAAVALGAEPVGLLIAATLTASLVFMLPVATPPNAVVFGSGRVRIVQMMSAGLWLNLLSILLVTAVVWLLLARLLPDDLLP